MIYSLNCSGGCVKIDNEEKFIKLEVGMKDLAKLSKQLILFTQFGLSVIMPLLLCLLLCWALTDRMAVGGWIYIPGFFFGLGGSGVTAWKMYLSVQKDLDNKPKNKKSYNDHG